MRDAENVFSPIGIFDSGYGGLTILREIKNILPEYDYIYLGDNARNPYGTRSFDVVYHYTRDAVKKLFDKGCPLVILACNTASAKALRTIQQVDLPQWDATKRVLGVIRPSVEALTTYTKNGHIGLLATKGTVVSESYPMEIQKLFGNQKFVITQMACPLWVSLVENNELSGPGAEYFTRKYIEALLQQDKQIDTVILGCTHYPLLRPLIRRFMPEGIQIIEQGHIVADSLKNYLYRHPEIDQRLSKNRSRHYYTTEKPELFDQMAGMFLGEEISSYHLD